MKIHTGKDEKSKSTAMKLAFLLGWLGFHKFYVGDSTQGAYRFLIGAPSIVLLVYALGFVPDAMTRKAMLVASAVFFGVAYIIGFFDGIGLLFMSRKHFDDFYG